MNDNKDIDMDEVRRVPRRFISQVLYIADANNIRMHAAGYADKIKWLEDTVRQYRKDMHKILKD